jgi:alpha-glucosidase
MVKRSFAFIVVGLMLLTWRPGPGWAEWHYVGAMTAEPPQGNSITFKNSEALVNVTALTPEVVRVRMTPGAAFGPDYSYAVVKSNWPNTPVTFTEAKQTETLRTSELEVRMQLSPFRISFYDRSSRLISKDADDMGMAWDGPRVRCWKWMPGDEHYFGLGEKGDTLDKRGHAYVMWNTDAYGWEPTTDPLYVSIPFFLALRSGRAYGLFLDNTYRSSFDMGKEFPDHYSFGAEGGEINYYFIQGPDPKQVVERYTDLTGRMPLADWLSPIALQLLPGEHGPLHRR